MHSSTGLVLGGLVLAATASSAGAQSSSTAETPAGASEQIQDIVVTARRTEENLQRIPVAVTALGANTIRTLQITDVIGLQRAAPSLLVATGSPGGAGFAYVSIRGHFLANPSVENDPSVGIYVDGVYIPRPSQGTVDLVDVERVEVLRGPQGTLFGRNTPGGALSIVTAQPTEQFEGSVRGEYGNYDYKNVRAILNAPVGAGLAARVVYNFSEHDSYGRNPLTGEGVASRRSHFVRGKLRWAPDESDWDVTLSADYNHIRGGSQLQTLSGFNPAIFGPALTPFISDRSDFYATYFNNVSFATQPKPYDKIVAWGASATINGKIGSLKVKSITGYRYSKPQGSADLDATPLAILEVEQYYPSRQISQEIQVIGDVGDRLNYIVGGYYSRETARALAIARAFGFAFPSLPFANDADVLNKSAGVFGQAYYQLTDQLRLTGGLRWTWDKRSVNLHNVSTYGDLSTCNLDSTLPGFIAPCSLPQTAKFNYPAWTTSLDFQATPDMLIYAKGSAASQAGGLNTRVGALPSYAPTKTTEVELGAKTSWFDNRLRFNVALFYEWQKGVQLNKTRFVPAIRGATQFLTNAGDARVYGAEFEANAAPWQGMLLTGTLSLLRGHFVGGTFNEDQTLPDGSTVVVDRSDEGLPQLPKIQYSIGATQKVRLSIGEMSLHLDYAYQSAQIFGQATAAAAQPQAVKDVYALANAANRIKGYGALNGRIGLQLSRPNLEIYMFGKNLTANKYLVRAYGDLFTAGLGLGIGYQGDPRTYGIGAQISF